MKKKNPVSLYLKKRTKIMSKLLIIKIFILFLLLLILLSNALATDYPTPDHPRNTQATTK